MIFETNSGTAVIINPDHVFFLTSNGQDSTTVFLTPPHAGNDGKLAVKGEMRDVATKLWPARRDEFMR